MQLGESMVAEVAGQVLETMAFAIVMPGTEEAAADPAAPLVRAVVGFHGPAAGRVGVVMPAQTLAELASNMAAGGEVGDGRAQLDALGELCNVICGNLLPAIAGPAAVFNLDPPQAEALQPDAGPPPAEPGAVRSRVCLMDGWVEVSVTLDVSAQAASQAVGAAARL